LVLASNPGASGSQVSVDGISFFFQSQRAGWNAELSKNLVQFINGTKSSLDCAIYDLRDPTVLDALKNQNQRGRKLRIAYDAGKVQPGSTTVDPKPSGTDQALKSRGLDSVATPVHEIGGNLMHDKFLVRDGSSLWTGSANFTIGGLQLQDNNCLSIDAPKIAASHEHIFQDLLSSAHQHPIPGGTAPSSQSAGAVKFGGTSIVPYFAPSAGEGVETAVASALKDSKRVRVLVFLISDPGILQALSNFQSASSDIRGVYDPNGMRDATRGSGKDPALFWFLNDKRFVPAPSKAFNPKGEQDFMHNKVMILDDSKVITGSYNFSEHAETNDENLMMIDSPKVAQAYTAYFNALYAKYGGKA
jgi:phosphatidylserine/phosphatidylglycerophosphate/cardiolipin synthase-like enzyme